MEKTYTEEQVLAILVAAQVFSNAKQNQGLRAVRGMNNGERAETILMAYDAVKMNPNSILETVRLIGDMSK